MGLLALGNLRLRPIERLWLSDLLILQADLAGTMRRKVSPSGLVGPQAEIFVNLLLEAGSSKNLKWQ
jgi:hypothetical protein